MSALTADNAVDIKEPGYPAFPVKDGEDIYQDALVCLDANGLIVPAANTAGLRFVGLSRDSIQNAADASCEVDNHSWFLATGSGFAATDVGRRVYVADDQTVSAAASSRSMCRALRSGLTRPGRSGASW